MTSGVKTEVLSDLIDEATLDSICAALERGLPLSSAAPARGIAVRTLRTWVARGKSSGEEPWLTIATRVTMAQARGEEMLEEEMPLDDWRAIAWRLGRADRVLARKRAALALERERLALEREKEPGGGW